MPPKGTARISAASRLRTVELYHEHKDQNKVARLLTEETGVTVTQSAVNSRLRLEYIGRSTSEYDFSNTIDRLKREVAAEEAANVNLPAKAEHSLPMTEAERFETLEAFVEAKTYKGAAKILRESSSNAQDQLVLSGKTIKRRLVTILGDKNAYPIKAKEKLAEMRRERGIE